MPRATPSEQEYSIFSKLILASILFCLVLLYLNYKGIFPIYSEAWSRYEFDPGSYPAEVLEIDESLRYTNGEFIVGEDMAEGEYRLIPMSNAARNHIALYENEEDRSTLSSITVEQPSHLTVKERNKVEISREVVAVPVEELADREMDDSLAIIDEGFYKVGEDIEAGTYTFSISSNYGYESLEIYNSSYPSEENRLDRIGYFPDLQTEITVNEGEFLLVRNAFMDESYDPFEHSERPRNDEVLERLQLDPEKEIYWEGIYEVGIDLPAGEYRLYVVNEERGATGWGEFGVYDNFYQRGVSQRGNLFYRFGYATVEDGEFFNLNNLLAVPIEQAAPEESTGGKYLQGVYQVGYDIAPGTYRVYEYSGDEPGGYYPEPAYVGVLNFNERLLATRSVDEEFEGNRTVTVEEGQWLKIDGAYLLDEDVQSNWENLELEQADE